MFTQFKLRWQPFWQKTSFGKFQVHMLHPVVVKPGLTLHCSPIEIFYISFTELLELMCSIKNLGFSMGTSQKKGFREWVSGWGHHVTRMFAKHF